RPAVALGGAQPLAQLEVAPRYGAGVTSAHGEAARLLMVGCAGPSLTARERDLLRALRPGAVVLFARNVASPEQLHGLVADLRAAAPGALLCVDLEGGRVDRLRALTGGAPAAARLAAAPPALAERSAGWIGRALRLFGFDLDLAPVVDL